MAHVTLNAPETPTLSTMDQFKLAFRHHPGGVALITASAGGVDAALTATSVTSVCADPAVIAFSVSSMSSSAPVFRETESVVVHLIDADTIHLAKLGATSGIDRFANISKWERRETGEPVFIEAPVWLRATIMDRSDIAGTMVILAQVTDTSFAYGAEEGGDSREGLVYVNRKWHRLTPVSEITE